VGTRLSPKVAEGWKVNALEGLSLSFFGHEWVLRQHESTGSGERDGSARGAGADASAGFLDGCWRSASSSRRSFILKTAAATTESHGTSRKGSLISCRQINCRCAKSKGRGRGVRKAGWGCQRYIAPGDSGFGSRAERRAKSLCQV
jgi:hypothetical protein